jgi:hypothetical protein
LDSNTGFVCKRLLSENDCGLFSDRKCIGESCTLYGKCESCVGYLNESNCRCSDKVVRRAT